MYGSIAGANDPELKTITSKNYAVNALAGEDKRNRTYAGENIERSKLSQAFFEGLSWNFKTIWRWDAEEKLPKLRYTQNQ